MFADPTRESYHQWMLRVAYDEGHRVDVPDWSKLFYKLDTTAFRCATDSDDANRAEDAVDLREHYMYELGISFDKNIFGDPSVLEVIVALSIRMETTIMHNDDMGDRSGVWFWNMIGSLGLGGLIDRFYDEDYVNRILSRWMAHEYEPNGKGSLFTVYSRNDMRSLSIWEEMAEYLAFQK